MRRYFIISLTEARLRGIVPSVLEGPLQNRPDCQNVLPCLRAGIVGYQVENL